MGCSTQAERRQYAAPLCGHRHQPACNQISLHPGCTARLRHHTHTTSTTWCSIRKSTQVPSSGLLTFAAAASHTSLPHTPSSCLLALDCWCHRPTIVPVAHRSAHPPHWGICAAGWEAAVDQGSAGHTRAHYMAQGHWATGGKATGVFQEALACLGCLFNTCVIKQGQKGGSSIERPAPAPPHTMVVTRSPPMQGRS